MIEQELIRIRKEIKKIRRSKKIRHQRTNYITFNVFISKLYEYSYFCYIRFQKILKNRQEFLKEIIAKKKIFSLYNIKIIKVNDKIFYFEILLLLGLQKQVFIILEKLILETYSSKLLELKTVIFSQNKQDKNNKLNNFLVSNEIFRRKEQELIKFPNKLKKYMSMNRKLIDNLFNKKNVFKDYEIDSSSSLSNSGILQGKKFKIKLYVISDGAVDKI